MAGIPSIMQGMLEGMYDYLEKGEVVHSRSFDIFVGESLFAEKLTEIQGRFTGLDIGSYPFSRDGKYGATIVIRSTDKNKLDACEKEIQSLIKEY